MSVGLVCSGGRRQLSGRVSYLPTSRLRHRGDGVMTSVRHALQPRHSTAVPVADVTAWWCVKTVPCLCWRDSSSLTRLRSLYQLSAFSTTSPRRYSLSLLCQLQNVGSKASKHSCFWPSLCWNLHRAYFGTLSTRNMICQRILIDDDGDILIYICVCFCCFCYHPRYTDLQTDTPYFRIISCNSLASASHAFNVANK